MPLINEIERVLAALVGLAMGPGKRVGALQAFEFRSYGVGVEEANTFGLHIDCAWRLAGPGGIVVGSRDVYFSPPSSNVAEGADFEWDVPGANVRDQRLEGLFKSRTEPLVVVGVEVGCAGSVSLQLTQNFILDIFPDDSLGEEYWRLLEIGPYRTHFVVTGEEILGYRFDPPGAKANTLN